MTAGYFQYDGWDPAVVLLAGLCGFAALANIYIGFCRYWDRHRRDPSAIKSANDSGSTQEHQFEPDIDPREAFRRILESSTWVREQRRTTTNAKNLIYDWLEVRLKTEIHKYLRNSLLSAWGEECLSGTATTPEKPIPPETWDKVEILFDRLEFPRAAAHWKGSTSREIGRMAWIAVKFSKDQIFQLFPVLDQVPLYDAATRVYEAIEDHMASVMVETFADSADEKLISVCEILAKPQGGKEPLVKLYGNHPPSSEIKQIYIYPLSRYDFVVDGTSIILQDKGDRYENLSVPFADIEPAILTLKQRAGEE